MNSSSGVVRKPLQFRVRTVLIWMTVLALSLGAIKSFYDFAIGGTITFGMIEKVKLGMKWERVRELLGPPAFRDSDDSTWSYRYRFNMDPWYGPVTIEFDEAGNVRGVGTEHDL